MLVGREQDQDLSWDIRDTVVTGRTYLMNQYGICDGITFTNVESDIYISNGGSGLPNEARNIHFRSCNIPVISNIIWKESSFTDCQLPGLVVNNGHRNLSFTSCEDKFRCPLFTTSPGSWQSVNDDSSCRGWL